MMYTSTCCHCCSVSGGKSEKTGGAANTFQAYQASVSDAWDIEVSVNLYKTLFKYNSKYRGNSQGSDKNVVVLQFKLKV